MITENVKRKENLPYCFPAGNPEQKPEKNGEIAGTDNILNLLYEVSLKIASSSHFSTLIENITRMTQQALKASASSVLLRDAAEQSLFFRVAEGQVKKQLKQVKLGSESGIAGWVTRHGKPLIVNDVSKDRRFNHEIDKATGFNTRSIICAPLIIQRRVIGAIEVINKFDGSHFTEQDMEALVAVASTAAISIENARLQKTLLDSYKGTIKSLAAAIDAKDPYTCGHSQRVTEYALLGGAPLSLPEEEMETLEYAGVLHDIGKIGIADQILTKPGPLTREEWQKMRQHPGIGVNILKEVPFLDKVKSLILHHHERYDGSGYPEGLNGEDIPMGARLLAVADAFDTMTTNRAYRSAQSVAHAIDELQKCSGSQFCPAAVNAMISALEKTPVTAQKPAVLGLSPG